MQANWPAVVLGLCMVGLLVALLVVVAARHKEERRKRAAERAAVEASLRRISRD